MIQFKQIAAVMLMAAAVMTASTVMTASAATMSVQVKDAPVRATPSFVGKVVGALAYGDQVEIQQTQGAWSSKKIVLAAGQEQAKVAASGDELALAGKGFNSDVEAQFKSVHKDIDFTWINRMEKIRIPATEMQAFLKGGDVTPREGGAK